MIDSADDYGNGHNEALVDRAIKTGVRMRSSPATSGLAEGTTLL
jgi:hypothetical protein